MIYTDEDGVVNVEYGHGSVMGFTTEKADDGYVNYSLSSKDPDQIGTPCRQHDELVGKLDSDIGVSVRLRFNNVDSLQIVINELEGIKKVLSS